MTPKPETKAKKPALPRLTTKQVMAELKAAGTAQNIKTFGNHGVTGDFFGVSYAFLKQLHRRVKSDHELALELWQTGNHDARVFACWAADGDKTTMKLLNQWAQDVDNHVLAIELASLAQDTDLAHRIMAKWIARKVEWPSSMGWGVASRLAMQPSRGSDEGGITEAQVGELLTKLEAGIQSAPNYTRHNMNNALISIGCRPKWKTKAIAAAKRIGKVEVNYGATSCSVTDAAARIEKTTSHYASRGKSPTDGTGGKRRRHC
ncbi:MAG: hypothetical protein ACI9D0_001929 [Bacteroidia bacterium]|jgi:hypothetical protein